MPERDFHQRRTAPVQRPWKSAPKSLSAEADEFPGSSDGEEWMVYFTYSDRLNRAPNGKYMPLLLADYVSFFFSSARGGIDTKYLPYGRREEKMIALLRQWRKAPDPQDDAFGSFIKVALSIFDLLGQISFNHPRIFYRPPNTSCYIHVPYVFLKTTRTPYRHSVSFNRQYDQCRDQLLWLFFKFGIQRDTGCTGFTCGEKQKKTDSLRKRRSTHGRTGKSKPGFFHFFSLRICGIDGVDGFPARVS